MFHHPVLAGMLALLLATTGSFAAGYGSSGGSSGGHSGSTGNDSSMSAQPSQMQPRGARLLTDGSGRTLYIFDKDSNGVSACYGSCARTWPPFITGAAKAPRGYGLVSRRDGSRQLAYRGHPLYRYSGDRRPGDTAGDGIGGIWHDVRIGG